MPSAVLVPSERFEIEEKKIETVDLDYCFEELAFIALAYQQEWANHLKDLLFAIQGQADWHSDHKLVLSEVRKQAYERCYNEIIMLGIWHPDNRLLWGQWLKEKTSASLTSSSKITQLEFIGRESRAKKLLDYLRVNKLKILALMWNAV